MNMQVIYSIGLFDKNGNCVAFDKRTYWTEAGARRRIKKLTEEVSHYDLKPMLLYSDTFNRA